MPSPTRAVLTLLPLLIVAIASCSSPRSSTNATEPGANTENPMLAMMKVEYREKVTEFQKTIAASVAYQGTLLEAKKAKTNEISRVQNNLNSFVRELELESTRLNLQLAGTFGGVSRDAISEADEAFREMGIEPISVMSSDQRSEIYTAELERLKSELREKLAGILAGNR